MVMPDECPGDVILGDLIRRCVNLPRLSVWRKETGRFVLSSHAVICGSRDFLWWWCVCGDCLDW